MLNKISLKALLFSMLAVTVVIVAVLAGVGFTALNKTAVAANHMGQGKDVVADILPPPLYVIEAQLVVYDLLRAEGNERQSLLTKLQSLKKEYDQRIDFWQKEGFDPQVKAALLGDQHKQGALFWQEAQASFIPAIVAGDMLKAEASAKTMRQRYEAHRKGVDGTVDIASKYADSTLSILSDTARTASWLIGSIGILGCFGMLFCVLMVVREILRRLGGEPLHLLNAAERVAAGDLLVDISVVAGDQSSLTYSFAEMTKQLRKVLTEVRDNSQHSLHSLHELKHHSAMAIEQSQQQSEGLMSVSASVEELSASVTMIADNAGETSENAGKARSLTETGGRLITETVIGLSKIAENAAQAADAVDGLESEVNEIRQFSTLIQNIAEQTNLLALNAAIEAARAGEAGRGFAVVADEVRKLAEQSSASAQKVNSVTAHLSDSTLKAAEIMRYALDRVREDSQKATVIQSTVEQLQNGAEETLQTASDITRALVEQKIAVQEIARVIMQISSSADVNYQVAKSVGDASTSMEAGIAHLSQQLSRFKI